MLPPPPLIPQSWVSPHPEPGKLTERKEGEREERRRQQTRDNLCPDLEASFLVTQTTHAGCLIHLAATQANPCDATHSTAKPPGPFSPSQEGEGGQRGQLLRLPWVAETHINTPLPRTQKPHLGPVSCPLSSLPAQPHFSLFSQHLHHAAPCPAPGAEALQHEEPAGLPLMPQKQCNPVAFLHARKEGNEQPLV